MARLQGHKHTDFLTAAIATVLLIAAALALVYYLEYRGVGQVLPWNFNL
jgi:hypothetical protein